MTRLRLPIWRYTLTIVPLIGCPTLAFARAPSALAVGSADGANVVEQAIGEAARRTGIPKLWIRAVIRVESLGDARAVSRKGAIGLMQLMPATYIGLRSSLDLGPDPFDIRDNVMAGAAYLRLMFDRYGMLGMIGAYNAGPARWEAYIGGIRSLPAETVAYIAKLAGALSLNGRNVQLDLAAVTPPLPKSAPIFVALTSGTTIIPAPIESSRVVAMIDANPTIVMHGSLRTIGPTEARRTNFAERPTVRARTADHRANGSQSGAESTYGTLFVPISGARLPR